MTKTFTLESLRDLLVARKVEVGPDTDIAATASNYIADRLAEHAQNSDGLVPNQKEAAARRLWLSAAAEAVRRNPFQNAPGSH